MEELDHHKPNSESSEYIQVRLRDIPQEEKFQLDKILYEIALELTFDWGETRRYKSFNTPDQNYEEKIYSIYNFIEQQPTKMRLKDDQDHEVLVDLSKVAVFKVLSVTDRELPDRRYS